MIIICLFSLFVGFKLYRIAPMVLFTPIYSDTNNINNRIIIIFAILFKIKEMRLNILQYIQYTHNSIIKKSIFVNSINDTNGCLFDLCLDL